MKKPRGERRAVESPSGLRARRKPRTTDVGGRVVGVDADTLLLADATAVVRVELAEPADPDLEPGELVVVRGKPSTRKLRKARLVERTPGAPPREHSEQSRFSLAGVGANLVARSRALRTVREYFDGRGFVEVETPFRVRTPGLDAHVDAIPAEGGYLVTSPELHMKRLLVGGLPRIYQIARTSRAGEHGSQHEPEFSLVEWYRAFSNAEAVMADTEELVRSVVRELAGKPVVRLGDLRVDVRRPFERRTVRQAFREHAGVEDAADLAATDPDRYFRAMVEQVEPALAAFDRPVFLTEYPATEAALARRTDHDPAVAERFELYLGGVELCNGFGELTDADEQRRRFEQERDRRRRDGSPVYELDERFLAALAEGMPPSGGNALGFDRLVALALGLGTIQDVIAFPAGV
ncbi:MAG TPA: EF-P lysine aminoacylase EpmA [Polyangiaceae bacterium]|nr:EF-P lysine aminoacylase EpmA [Polyangiaceae bacterium]